MRFVLDPAHAGTSGRAPLRSGSNPSAPRRDNTPPSTTERNVAPSPSPRRSATRRKSTRPPRRELTPESAPRPAPSPPAARLESLAASPGHRASSEQCRFCTVIPRPAFRSPADTTRYSASISGKIICRTFTRDVLSGPARSSSGSQSRNLCTIRKISSADSCVCATCSVRVPGRVSVFRKKRAAVQVVIPSCRAFSTMLRSPRRRSKARCAALAQSGSVPPSRVLTRSRDSVNAIPTLRPHNAAGHWSRIIPKRTSSARSIDAKGCAHSLQWPCSC